MYVLSTLCWILTGPVDLQSTHTSSMLTTVAKGDIKQSFKRFWELESTINIREDTNPIISKDEEYSNAAKNFYRELNFDAKNYEV